MRFCTTVTVAATAAMLLTGGVTVATVGQPPIPRPIGFSTVADPAPAATTSGAGRGTTPAATR